MTKIKKEKLGNQNFPCGTLLAVDLYSNGNYFEAILKNNKTDKKNKGENWGYMQYLDEKETKGWIDLNVVRVVELSKENILTQEDRNGKSVMDDEKGFLGRRLTVLWVDDARYTGTITKTMKDNKNFVFISYDNGDKCWYSLLPENEEPSKFEESQGAGNKKNRKSTAKSSARVKKEEEEASTGKKSNIDADFQKHEMERKELEKKYPIGSTIAVDIYHDEHYHEAIVKKYLLNTTKKQQARGEQWVYIQFLDKANTKQWIDLKCIKAIKRSPGKTLRFDELKPGDEKGFLGKRIVVVWPDGNKYRGLATRSAKEDKHFVFIEYDDGDECWCDLQRESEWNIDGEDSVDSDDDAENNAGNISSDESSEEENSTAKSKRKGNNEDASQLTKKAKLTDESYDF